MVLRIGSFFVQHLYRFPIEMHKLSFKSQVIDLRNITTECFLEEESQAVGISKKRTFHGNLLNVRRLREIQGLSRLEVCGANEVKIVLVQVELKRFGRRVGG